MIVFCLTVCHLWGLTLVKHNQDAHAVAYVDDGYIRAKLSVAIEVLFDIKQVLKEDAGLTLNDKTKILVKGISEADAHAASTHCRSLPRTPQSLVPCSLPCLLWLTATLALGFPLALMLLSSTL